MRDRKLRIGRIPYANLFPIFYALETECDCSSYEFVEGVPSKANRMLRDGKLDVSSSSSIEYLRNPADYRIIEGNSVSSRGPVGSIFLFSKKPIEQLDGSGVKVTSQSETSVALLDVIFRKFYGIQCTLQAAGDPESAGGDAYLLIGDDALKAGNDRDASCVMRHEIKDKDNESLNASRITHHASRSSGSLLSYDLGDIWYRRTGLPFVFALWIVREDLYHDNARLELLMKFADDLNRAKLIALRNLPEIARHAPMKAFLSEKEIISYWNKLDYELSPEHRKGLELFKKYLLDISYL